MKLVFEQKSEQYYAQCTFAEKDIPKKAGFRWDPDLKMWWTNDVTKAQQLAGYADPDVRTRIMVALEQKAAVIELSSKTSTTQNFPVPTGLDYLPYQKAGIAYGIERENVLFGDEMGLGKTIQAIGLYNATSTMKRVLVVCPASLKLNWKREFTKWAARPMTIAIATSILPTAEIVIINYEALKRFHTEIRAIEWDYLICDEAHYMKNSRAQRAKEVLGFWSPKPEEVVTPIPAKKKAFLTGTPLPNRPSEIFTLLHALAPTVFKSWKFFVSRYCAGYRGEYGWVIGGASNLDELQMKLRESIMVRRLKVDVLKELPAKRRQVIELASDGATKVIKAELDAYNKRQEKLTALRVNVELAKTGTQVEYEAAVLALKEGTGAVFAEMAKMRHDTAIAKVPFVIDFLQECFEAGETKIVLFAHHLDVIEKIAAAFVGETAIVTGEVPVNKRQQEVDKFQNDPEIKLFLGNSAAEVGYTLTAANHVIFAELDWVPGNMSQREDRCHRIGQTESVLVQHLVFEGSIDVDIAYAIIEKQAVIDATLDGFELDVVLPGQCEIKIPVVTKTVQNIEVAKSVKITAKEIEQTPEFTTEQREAIHSGLRQLASICDGAYQLDNAGFNKIDTGIGKSLAAAVVLTDKQAVLGRKLVIKYQRQLSKELIAIIK